MSDRDRGRRREPEPAPFDGDVEWVWSSGGVTDPVDLPDSPFRACRFRRTFEVSEGASATVHVSADSEYVLYCNGTRVGSGPAKGDVAHQFYDSYDLNERLRAGENVLAALVVSYAPSWDGGPTSRISAANAFVLDGAVWDSDSDRHERLATGTSGWTASPAVDMGHEPRPGRDALAGADERVDGRKRPHGWTTAGFDADDWEPATAIAPAVRRGEDDSYQTVPYRLCSRPIPDLEEQSERFEAAYQVDGVDGTAVAELLTGDGELTVHANQSTRFVLDAGEMTTGYPLVDLRGGEGATVEFTYAEAFHRDGEKVPHHVPETGEIRGTTDDRHTTCHGDRYIAGGDREHYEPLSWRAFRYVAVEVDAADEPVMLADLSYRFTGYPFKEHATFDSSNPVHDDVWDVSWRTVRRCAHETFEDCPYYEQLQYAGDTQPVMLYAGYVSGDWRLARQAVYHFDWSRDHTGLTKSRYPSRVPQKIPSWSLLWVKLVRDYWWHTGDEGTVGDVLDGVDATLSWFADCETDAGVVADLPHWKVVDWVPEWEPRGVPPGAIDGVSAVINLQYAAALRDAAELHDACGDASAAANYRERADRVCAYVNRECWDAERGLYRDRPDGDEASQLGNAWAILAGAADGERTSNDGRASAVAGQLLDEGLPAATLYGRYYVLRALSEADRYGAAADLLDDWTELLAETDLTTWPERFGQGGSYCHAWSSAPLYEFLAEVLGVTPAEPGFEAVRVEPQPLDLDRASGTVPTPAGEVSVRWERAESFDLVAETPEGVGGTIILPDGTTSEIDPGSVRIEVDGR